MTCCVRAQTSSARRVVAWSARNESRSYLSQLEKGSFYASLKIIGRLAEALGVEPAELLRLPQRG